MHESHPHHNIKIAISCYPLERMKFFKFIIVSQFSMSSTEGLFQELPIRELRISSNAIRDYYPLALTQLASSIKEKGLMQPIVVRPKKSYYEIVAGHRRFHACKFLHWTRVMCHVVEVDDKEAYELSLIENLQQKSMNPIEEGKAFRQYVKKFGWGGESDLARKIGKSQEYISRRIRLLDLPEEMQQEIMRNRISVSLAQELFPLNDSESQEAIKFIEENQLNSKQTRQLVRVMKSKASMPFNLPFGNSVSNDNEQYEKLIPSNNQYTGIYEAIDTLSTQTNDIISRERNDQLLKLINNIFKKSVLALRISMKSIDMQLNEIEHTLEEEENMKERGLLRDYNQIENGNIYSRNAKWLIKEIIMQHRIQLHNQLDIMMKEQQKILEVLDLE
jgi:ParB family chromosome partitioning protein